MRKFASLLVISLIASASIAFAETSDSLGELTLDISTPTSQDVFTAADTTIDVQGSASIFGGVTQIDLFLVLDTSRSLRETDPKDHRTSGAIGLIESLPERSDIRVGIVAFDREAELVAPLTSDRAAVIEALKTVNRHGFTNIGGGIEKALTGFKMAGRDGSSKMMLVFTDGRSNAKKAREAMRVAAAEGVVIHSLLLGYDRWGKEILQEIAGGTGGQFIQVKDPAKLPEAFLNLRTTGVDYVSVSVNDGPEIRAQMTLGTFSLPVALAEGENRIVAQATSVDGRVAKKSVIVSMREPGCSELEVQAMTDGQPAVSISDRSVEIVVDASLSMWGQIDGVAKMEIAKNTLRDALGWLPEELSVSLRAYGHQYARTAQNCEDTALLVSSRRGNRQQIREAISGLKPNGQTPIAHTLKQTARDLANVRGERAVILVTDGLESCGGDPAQAARELQRLGRVPVHVIGFGLGSGEDEDLASLRAIARASGGRFITASDATELREALSTTVGTPFRVMREAEMVGSGTLGSNDLLMLPPGQYEVLLDSTPAQQIPVELTSEVRHRLVFHRDEGNVHHTTWQDPTDYASCDEPVASEMSVVPAKMDTGAAAPKQRKVKSYPASSGVVEIWQNLRPERKTDWGVVIRHSDQSKGTSMVWRGNDRAMADEIAQSTRETMGNLK